MPYLQALSTRLLSLVMVCSLLLGCAKEIPNYTPPAQRTIASHEKPWPTNHYLALAYHAVQDDQADQAYLAVRTDQLIAQLQWLHANGYQAVSIDQILAAQQGGPALPPRALLLSFDDGYKDFETRVLPILKAFAWPAVLAPVGAWLSAPTDQPVSFGDTQAPRSLFLQRQDLARIAQSELIEIGAHSYNHHHGLLGNPQGNRLPAMANRQYLPAEQRYENDGEFEQRLRTDIAAITHTLQSTTGKTPRVWVWPYGATNGIAQRMLREAGYQLFLTLEEGLASVERPDNVPRLLLSGRDDIRSITQRIISFPSRRPLRVAHVDLDYVYDPNPVQLDRNLDTLVQRIEDMGVNTVFLQAFANPEGDGLVRQVYFPNRVLPVRADLFNRVAWQLKSRLAIKLYAWMPVLSLDLPPSHPRVQRWHPQHRTSTIDPQQYQRLSPFNAHNRSAIVQLYEDLARHAAFDGLLFHDDALLSDFEDASPDALQAYAAAGFTAELEHLRSDPQRMHAWTRWKSRYLVDFTHELTSHVRAIRGPHIKTARNIFVAPLLQPAAEAWFAQNFDDFLTAYDWTIPMVMPLMEGISYAEAPQWIDRVVQAVQQRPQGLERTVFELQAKDWRPPARDIDSTVLADWMRRLQIQGAQSLGYYPDNFVQAHPRLEAVRPYMSTAWFPAPK